jgi:hypothetical protein
MAVTNIAVDGHIVFLIWELRLSCGEMDRSLSGIANFGDLCLHWLAALFA